MLRKYLIFTLFSFLGFSATDSIVNGNEPTAKVSNIKTAPAHKSTTYSYSDIKTNQKSSRALTSQKANKASNTKELVCYVTNTGSKYHTENCSYLKHSMIGLSLMNAKTQGYGACSRCQPRSTNLSNSENNQRSNSINTSSRVQRNSYAVQCSGTTQKGRRCRNRTKNSSGYCHHHD